MFILAFVVVSFVGALLGAPDVIVAPPLPGGDISSLTPEQGEVVLRFLADHKWLPVIVLGIHQLVRLFKTDTKLPWDIDPKRRKWFAIGLGFLAGVGDAAVAQFAKNEPFTLYLVLRCITEGITAGGGAILFQNFVVDGWRDGRELWLPRRWLKPGVPPAPGKPASIPPADMSEADKTATAKKIAEARDNLTADQQHLVDSFTLDLGKPTTEVPPAPDSPLPPVLDPQSVVTQLRKPFQDPPAKEPEPKK